MLGIILTILLVIASFILIGVVLLQSGKADAAALFGGGGAQTFGPRGTATILQKVTVGSAIAFMIITFLFMVGIGGPRSAASGIRERAPVNVPAPQPTPPANAPAAQPSATPAPQSASPTGTPTPQPNPTTPAPGQPKK
ncbi:MAG TPA: preprotein translocase subunit SecG [Blastocatellia bacterium]|nr:preprotein translocase subunit SecG [Blastocatellia bacterium]